MKAGRKLCLVLDFTHDILFQFFKLGVISIASLNFTCEDWCNTVFPVTYCLARKENSAAYLPMISALKNELLVPFGIELEKVIEIVFLHGHEACKISLGIEFPDSKQILCLQHARTNL